MLQSACHGSCRRPRWDVVRACVAGDACATGTRRKFGRPCIRCWNVCTRQDSLTGALPSWTARPCRREGRLRDRAKPDRSPRQAGRKRHVAVDAGGTPLGVPTSSWPSTSSAARLPASTNQAVRLGAPRRSRDRSDQKVRDIYIPDLQVSSGIKVPTRDFRQNGFSINPTRLTKN